ncbi:MAG TPA: YfhO family protein [Pyrinomonadaceae bacterium]|nr:YfhO family protein [Pyrinomonadaceae bacterium]
MYKRSITGLLARRREDVVPMLVIIAFFVLCFVPIMLQGRFFLLLDAFTEMLPERVVAWNALRHGTAPLWTPLILSGYPLLSMAQIGLAYPLTWGYLFLPPYWAEQIYVLAPFLLTPVFTYCYARYIGRTSTASLLSALAYGYGGVLIIPDIPNGLLPNATMWLPLFLIAIERSRKKDFISSWLWATGPYAMSVLTGIGQGFLFVGMVGQAYAFFLVVFAARVNEDHAPPRWSSLVRWRPLFVTAGAIMLSIGIAAFQILETMRAQRRSIRAALTYEMFTDPSLTFWGVIKFVITTPFYNFQDVCTAYVPPLALILAAVSLYLLWRRKVKDVRILFWLGAAVSAWVLMMGNNTFVYRLLYHFPVLNKFREPPRYAVIWTFAIAVLAAYGFDALAKMISAPMTSDRRNRRQVIVTVTLLVLSIGLGAVWSKPWIRLDLTGFLAVKASLCVLVVLALWHGLKTGPPWRNGLVVCAIVLACFIEPFALITNWWWPKTKPSSRVTVPAPPTRFLQQFPPDQNRVYTFVEIFSEEFNPEPAVDCPNLTMLHGLQNVAGYEPLLLQRYSRALGNVWLDAVTTLQGMEPDRSLFQSDSKVLDLLNNTYVLIFPNPLLQFENSMEMEGFRFAKRSTKVDLLPGRQVAFSAMTARADSIAIVSALANSAALQGLPVATVRLTTMDGRTIERQLRAGIDTAEWAHERPDVRNVVGHSLAPVFESYPGDQQNSFPAYKYWTRIGLGSVESLDRVEITNLTESMTLSIDKITLYDSITSSSTALTLGAGPFDFNKWQPVYNERGVMILKNSRALPRAWIVSEAEAVDGEEALRRIRGQGQFDPSKTVLLEVKPDSLPKLSRGPISAASLVRIVSYEPNRMMLETESATDAVLVVSELNYPGWVATIDGQNTPIHTANFLLRAVVLPAGRHQVEMRYTAPAARNGAMISGFSLLLLWALGIRAWWQW